MLFMFAFDYTDENNFVTKPFLFYLKEYIFSHLYGCLYTIYIYNIYIIYILNLTIKERREEREEMCK